MQESAILAKSTVNRNFSTLGVWIGTIIAAPKKPADKLISKSENNFGRTISKLLINK
jgi:hypothetical protein